MRKGYMKYIVLSILFFSTINIVYQVAVVNNPTFNIYDLAVNLLSEFTGMIFTVLIFNEFLIYRQKLGNANKFRLLYIELDALANSLDFPFRAAAKTCMDDCSGDIWNKEVIDTIRDRIVLSKMDDCVFPVVPWYMIFSMQGDKIMRKCESIRNQYQDILEPRIADDLFYLTNSSEMLTDLSDIKKIYENDLLLNYSRPPNLGSYFACPTEHDFEVIKHMNYWIRANKKVREKEAAGMGRYKQRMLLVMAALFIIGAVGYFYNGSYFYGALFTAVTAMLCAMYIRFYRKKGNRHGTNP